MQVTEVKIGDPVKVVDENYAEHVGLVTTVHGKFDQSTGYVPVINVAYISGDESKHDPYGRQIERLSSLMHHSQVLGMPKAGRYWANL